MGGRWWCGLHPARCLFGVSPLSDSRSQLMGCRLFHGRQDVRRCTFHTC